MHLPDNNHTVLISPADSKLIKYINGLGIKTIFSDKIEALRKNEQYHADIQTLRINNTTFVSGSCNKHHIEKLKIICEKIIVCSELSEEYPENIKLNALFISNLLLCKVSAIDKKLREYCINNNIKLVNVNQGYTKCSALKVNDRALITADITIYNAAIENNIDALLITPGDILLEDADYGFIGGASGTVGKTIIFFGDITAHPDYISINEFLKKHNMRYSFTPDQPLTDIGGLVQLA